MRLLLYWGW